jgi:hypothetical protein
MGELTWQMKSLRFGVSNNQVVAARATTAGSEHGAVGGAVGSGSVRHTAKKEGCLDWLFFPPPTALRELDPRPPGQRD